MKPKVKDQLDSIVIEGQSVVYDDSTGDVHLLNPAATAVFQLCDGGATVKELARDIAEVCELAVDEVEAHVRAVIKEFKRMGLIEPPARRQQGDTKPRADASTRE